MLGGFARCGDLAAGLAPNSKRAVLRHFPDSRISREDKLARAQSGLFEILRVGREDLPAGHPLSELLNRAHVRKLPPQTLVVLLGRGQAHSISTLLLVGVRSREQEHLTNLGDAVALAVRYFFNIFSSYFECLCVAGLSALAAERTSSFVNTAKRNGCDSRK